MIISASRRTDIPAYYSEWLFNRLAEEYVLVRNPMNMHQVSRINLSPDVVDGIVFWTKNPQPMLERIPKLEKYNYYFQFTLNSYGRDVETNLPAKNKHIISTFQRLSKLVGRERVIWRYDPILFTDKYTAEYHCKYFKALADKLGDYTEKCIVSFVDFYRCTVRNTKLLKIWNPPSDQKYELIKNLAEIARAHGFGINTCAEAMDFTQYGVGTASCIDKKLLERIGNCKLRAAKDAHQRPECGCIASVDIGAYNTCPNGCLYCYANYSKKAVDSHVKAHNPQSPLLFGELGPDDVVHERKVFSCKEYQLSLDL